MIAHPFIIYSYIICYWIYDQLYADCGNTVKRIALELGGNAPFIVFKVKHKYGHLNI